MIYAHIYTHIYILPMLPSSVHREIGSSSPQAQYHTQHLVSGVDPISQ